MARIKYDAYLMSESVIRIVTVCVCIFYYSALLIYCFSFLPAGTERTYRLSISLCIMLAGILINFDKKIPPLTKSWLVPLIAVGGESIFVFLNGGDNLFLFYVIACEIISFIFLIPFGMLLYFLFSNVFLIPMFLVFKFNVLGEGHALAAEYAGLFIYELIGILLFSVSYMLRIRIQLFDQAGYTFRAIMKTTPNYTVIINQNAEVEYISASLTAKTGFIQGEYMGKCPLLDLFSSADMKMKFQDFMERSGFIEENFEAVVGEKKMWFMLRSSPLEKEGLSRLFEWTDVTPIMEAKEAAESGARAKNDFLTNMSHEIRTPMNAIIGMTDLMLTNPLEPEQMIRADTIKGAALSLLNIINDILDFSKIDARKMEIIYKPFNFAAFIADTVNMIAVKASAVNLSLTTAVSKDIPLIVNCDEIRLKQCLVNILNNAVKFSDKGYIQLRVWAEPLLSGSCRLRFTIRDTGRGIKKEDIGKLFGEFQQLDTRKNRNIEGTGLGLAITRRLVELMGGTISVDSIYGEGTVFSFYVISEGRHEGKLAEIKNPEGLRVLCYEPHPYNARAFWEMLQDIAIPGEVCIDIGKFKTLLNDGKYTHVFFDGAGKNIVREFLGRQGMEFILLKEVSEKYDRSVPNVLNRPLLIMALADVLNGKTRYARRPTRKDEFASGSLMLQNCRVLAVDDNEVNLAVASGLLQRYSITVDTASGGEEALAKAREKDYDIIFMDHMMPGMDGLDTTRAIRALEGPRSRVVIIALTANAVVGFQEQFLAAGMNGFLSKPIIIKDLREVLLNYLPPEKIVSS